MLRHLYNLDGFKAVQQFSHALDFSHDFLHGDIRETVSVVRQVIPMSRAPHIDTFHHCPQIVVAPALNIVT